MKPIKRTSRFVRHYKTRIAVDIQLRTEFMDAVAIFLHDPAAVRDHALMGRMSRDRAFAVNDEYRVIYTEMADHYLFKDIGKHQQVYYW